MAGPWEKYQKAAPAGPWARYAPRKPEGADRSGPLGKVDAAVRGVADAATFGFADEIAAAVRSLGSKTYAEALAEERAVDRADERQNAGQRIAGQLIGGVGSTVLTGNPSSMARSIGSAGLQGAAYGFGSGEGDGASRGFNALTSGVASMGAAGALGGVQRVIAPKISAAARNLMAEGVTLTPGQLLGGGARMAEDALTSIAPAIATAKTRTVHAFNRAVVNRALKPLGKSLPDDIPAGHDAIAHAQSAISDAYQRVLPSLKIRFDQQFATDAADLVRASAKLPEAQRAQFKVAIQEAVDAFQKRGATGEALNSVQSELKRLGRSYGSSAVGGERELGGLLKSLDEAIFESVRRANPGKAGELKAIRRGTAILMRAERAATMAKDGVFTPAQLQTATRVMDTTSRKRSSAAGRALLQDIATDARGVLPSTVGDSGTATRLLVPGALAAGGSTLAGNTEDPRVQALGSLAAIIGGAGLAYSPAGQKALQAAITRRPSLAQSLAQYLQFARPIAVTGGALAGSEP